MFRNDKFLTLAVANRYLQESGHEANLESLIKAKGLPENLGDNFEFKNIVEKFNAGFNLDFNPTASVIGAIVSQEIVKVITQRDFPSHGLAVYDSLTEKCQFE
jgi:hypothetical protein